MQTVHVERTSLEEAVSAPAVRPEPCVTVILGASGDLTHRKPAPALYQSAADNQLPECSRIAGFARSRPQDNSLWESFAPDIEYHESHYDDLTAFQSLRERLQRMNGTCSVGDNRLFYLATPPALYQTILGNRGAAGLIHEPNKARGRSRARWQERSR